MKVFISHKHEDTELAKQIAKQFYYSGTSCYLDVFDSCEVQDGKALTDHIKNSLNSCTDILVVMSDSTKYSQWVPFEIGMATQIDMPTVTYLSQSVILPEYLEYWPRLRSLYDITTYINIRKQTHENTEAVFKGRYTTDSSKRGYETRSFYDEIKKVLARQYQR